MSIKYRPEIDGLRAIAVLSVVLYHAGFVLNGGNPFQGGFIGVDIFFVISGYLITSIILREIEQGKFSFTGFYERRARRILPALFLVMLVSIPFAWDLLLPAAMKDYTASILSSLMMISNYWFAYSDSYWGEPSALKPFLHTWSLSVEEQFYVLFPLLLLLGSKVSKRAILPLMIGLFIVSLGFAEFMRRNNPEFAFFLLPSRGWELLAGAILAKTQDRYGIRNSAMERLLPATGLVMILAAIFYFDKNTPHPSLFTLIPVLGSVLIIRFAKPDEWVGRLLSMRAFVWIGLISYSLYLWHFPVFAFERIKHGGLTTADKVEGIILSFALAVMSYFLVEKTARNKAITPKRYFAGAIALSITAISVFNLQGYRSEGYSDRYVDFQKLIEYEHYSYEKDFLSHSCFLHPEDMTVDEPFANCQFNAKQDNKPILMLWGDSNAAHLIPGIREVYGNKYQLLIRTASGCGAFIGLEVPRRPGCREITDDILRLAIKTRPDKLIIAGLWKPEFPPLLKKTLLALQQAEVTNIEVLGPVPRWQGSLPRALINHGQTVGQTRSLPKYLIDPRHQEVFDVEQKMLSMVDGLGVKYVSLLDLLCKPGLGCLTQSHKNDLMQWDYGHLTSSGASFVVSKLKANDDNN